MEIFKFGNSKKGLKVGSEPSRPTPIFECTAPPPLRIDLPCGAEGACAEIDVWLPESMRNNRVLQAPTINDPNATVTLDVRPPVSNSSGNCATLCHNYDNLPDNTVETSQTVSERPEAIAGGIRKDEWMRQKLYQAKCKERAALMFSS